MYAFIFDMFMIGLTSKLVMFTYTSFLKTYFHQLRYQVQDSLISKMNVVHVSVLMIVFFSYFFASMFTSEGKTLGKMLFGLRVYSPSKPALTLTLGESFRRSVGYLVCYTFGFFLFAVPLFRADRKGIPDFLSETEVTFEDHFMENILPLSESENSDQLNLFDSAA